MGLSYQFDKSVSQTVRMHRRTKITPPNLYLLVSAQNFIDVFQSQMLSTLKIKSKSFWNLCIMGENQIKSLFCSRRYK